MKNNFKKYRNCKKQEEAEKESEEVNINLNNVFITREQNPELFEQQHCTLTDFVNDIEALKERVKKLEEK